MEFSLKAALNNKHNWATPNQETAEIVKSCPKAESTARSREVEKMFTTKKRFWRKAHLK